MKVNRPMWELWSKMWQTAQLNYSEFGAVKKEIMEKYPKDYHFHLYNHADLPYFNIGQAEMTALWNEVHANGF